MPRSKPLKLAPESVAKTPLLRELRVRQCRLGTKEERSDDFAEICRLAHELNNLRTVEMLARELQSRDERLAG
jgi:hypothetical protein